MQKLLVGEVPSTWNFGSNWSHWSEIADFRSIFARSTLAVKSSEKVLLSLIGSPPLRAFQWAHDEHRTLSLSPQVWLKNAVSKIRTISCDNSATIRDRLLLLLITNRKLHAGFWLVPTSMTLNDLERRNSPNFAFFTDFDCFADQLHHNG